MEFRVLGPVEVRVDGRTIDIGPRLQRRLLALLVLNVNRVVPAEVLVAWLVPVRAPVALVCAGLAVENAFREQERVLKDILESVQVPL